jgi:hypothetical protein
MSCIQLKYRNYIHHLKSEEGKWRNTIIRKINEKAFNEWTEYNTFNIGPRCRIVFTDFEELISNTRDLVGWSVGRSACYLAGWLVGFSTQEPSF